MNRRKYKIKREMPDGDHVALRFAWTGALTVPLGPISAGRHKEGELSGNFGVQEGWIVCRRNYDGYEA